MQIIKALIIYIKKIKLNYYGKRKEKKEHHDKKINGNNARRN